MNNITNSPEAQPNLPCSICSGPRLALQHDRDSEHYDHAFYRAESEAQPQGGTCIACIANDAQVAIDLKHTCGISGSAVAVTNSGLTECEINELKEILEDHNPVFSKRVIDAVTRADLPRATADAGCAEMARTIVEGWDDLSDLETRITFALTAAESRGAERQRESDAKLVENYHECPGTNDYNIAADIRTNTSAVPRANGEITVEATGCKHCNCTCDSCAPCGEDTDAV